jgi:predicted DsbA family dithiol-disulfide isomerase
MPTVAVTEFTDPGCPFAFSAEPHRWRLRWLYGDQLEWCERMVVLAEKREDYAAKGFDPAKVARSSATLAERYEMPMTEEVKPAVAATLPACRAVVAARLHAPGQERPLLRRLRHLHFAGPLLDDPATIAQAATDVGLDWVPLEAWMAETATEEALRDDMRLARDPTRAALALTHKLASTPEGGWRYTCPSLELRTEAGAAFSAPGFQSSLAYETALVNVEPGLQRRSEPEDVTDVLAWAGVPLATAEVAEVCGSSHRRARERLDAAGAVEEPVGRDAFWTLAA